MSMQKLIQSFSTLKGHLKSSDYWIGFTIGAIIFVFGSLVLTIYNQSNGFTSPEVIAGNATFYHPVVVSAALEWPCGLPITGLLVASTVGLLKSRGSWAKPLGLFLLFVLFVVYLIVAIFRAIGANVQGPSHLVD